MFLRRIVSRHLIAYTLIAAFFTLAWGFDDLMNKVSEKLSAPYVGSIGGEAQIEALRSVSSVIIKEPQDVGPTCRAEETEADRILSAFDQCGLGNGVAHYAMRYVESEVGPRLAVRLLTASVPIFESSEEPRCRVISDELWNDLYAHVARVNELSLRVYFLANYSDVSSENDDQVVDLTKSVTSLDVERQEILRRLLVEIADFDGYYDLVVQNTILPAWINFAMNAVGFEKAMWARGGSQGRLDTPDFSRPEFQAELTSHILYIPES